MRFIIFWIVPLVLSAQSSVIRDSIYEDPTEEVILLRTEALRFAQKMHKICEPSIVSIRYMDFTKNMNPDWQKKPYSLHTTIQPIIRLGGKRWYFGKFVHTLQASPSIVIRVLSNDSSQNDHSLPVRTPGFIARFSYYISMRALCNDTNRVNWFAGIHGFHHSNGQDGYEFAEYEYREDSVSSPKIVNTYNGNFSEVIVWEPMIGGTVRSKTSPEKLEKLGGFRTLQCHRKQSEWYWKLSYEYHAPKYTSLRFMQYHLYGRKRINLQWGYMSTPWVRDIICKKKKCWVTTEKEFHPIELRRIILNTSYIADGVYNEGSLDNLRRVGQFNLRKRLNIDVTWYERLGSKNDCAFFVRIGYYGSDPYNIYFQQSLYVARLGLAFGVFSVGEKSE